MDILQTPSVYADKLLAAGIDPSDAAEMVRDNKASNPDWRAVPQSWVDAVAVALHTPR